MTAASPTGTGAPGYSETLPCEPGAAHRARLLVSAALNTWGIDELADIGQLVVSELVNNSVNHAKCRAIRVLISRQRRGVVRIGVADKSREVPVMSHPDDDAEDGRGLLLIDSMSRNWGYDRKHWGKIVWAELAVPTEC
ncbi:ATP-binding protein [Streptomyces sirii]|uniref:ATP-binding protein n=1 Tax=Streptomyces sirii TaxID=3127701 RepID=UPI003D36327F